MRLILCFEKVEWTESAMPNWRPAIRLPETWKDLMHYLEIRKIQAMIPMDNSIEKALMARAIGWRRIAGHPYPPLFFLWFCTIRALCGNFLDPSPFTQAANLNCS